MGSFSPLVSQMIEEQGFEGIYVSGAVISSDLGLPDLELITLSDLAGRGGLLAQASQLPCLVDADTGFLQDATLGGSPTDSKNLEQENLHKASLQDATLGGSPTDSKNLEQENLHKASLQDATLGDSPTTTNPAELSLTHTVRVLESAGFCGLHIEDQQSPKKCGHLKNKKLIPALDMQKKIEIALKAREDSNFVISARTDARGVEGLKSAVKRAKAYKEAGAEVIFPEALKNIDEFRQFREALDLPLIANMTEFGQSELISFSVFKQLGYNIVLYPVTLWRLALKAVQSGLEEIKVAGHQKDLINKMFTRKQLYKLLNYDPDNF